MLKVITLKENEYGKLVGMLRAARTAAGATNPVFDGLVKAVEDDSVELPKGTRMPLVFPMLVDVSGLGITWTAGKDFSRVAAVTGPPLKDLSVKVRSGDHCWKQDDRLLYREPRAGRITELVRVGGWYSPTNKARIDRQLKNCIRRFNDITLRRGTGIVIKTERNRVHGMIDAYRVVDIKALEWDKLPRAYQRADKCVYLGKDGHLWLDRPGVCDAILLRKGHTYSARVVKKALRICDEAGEILHQINKKTALCEAYGMHACRNGSTTTCPGSVLRGP